MALVDLKRGLLLQSRTSSGMTFEWVLKTFATKLSPGDSTPTSALGTQGFHAGTASAILLVPHNVRRNIE